ncbi:Hsp20/alpha crystallin family protein [Phenylobacterium sp.]|jgi:HSP20 family protein|uniref:Hsp20/alpha crystallin family protein n=1 Tax=Phenylobacterium sp. TaxID=1871053 RepID=UPI002F3F3728
MAETPQSTPNADKTQSPQRDGERKGGQTVQGEARSFQQNGGDLAHDAAETGRQMAETGRRAGREVAESWRASMEPFTAMQMEMNRWFDDTFRQLAGFGLFPSLRAARPFAMAGAAPLFGQPAADIKETDKAYLLDVELPGLTRDDVEIAIQGDVLSISGHKAEVRDDATAAYRISERRFGRFERAFPIPPDVERNRIEAAFRDGVLKITLPRDTQAGPPKSRIEIKG